MLVDFLFFPEGTAGLLSASGSGRKLRLQLFFLVDGGWLSWWVAGLVFMVVVVLLTLTSD
jgi:hypothetical protein